MSSRGSNLSENMLLFKCYKLLQYFELRPANCLYKSVINGNDLVVILCLFQYLKLWHCTVSWSKAQWCFKCAAGMLVGRRKVSIGACFSWHLERYYRFVMILSLQHWGFASQVPCSRVHEKEAEESLSLK